MFHLAIFQISAFYIKKFRPVIANHIDWSATWHYINNNQKISNFSHSFQSSTLKSFRVKILLDELPTPHTLFKRNHYSSSSCHQCNQISTPLHWVTCPSSALLHNLIDNSLQQIINSTSLGISPELIITIHNQIKHLDSITFNYNQYTLSINSTLSGLVFLDII